MWSGDGGEGGEKRGMGSEAAPPPLPSGPPGPHGECVQGVCGGHRHLRGVSARCCRLCPFPFNPPPAILPERDEGSVAMRVPVQPRDGKVAEPGAGSGRAGGGGAGAEGGGRRRTGRRRRRQRGESEGGRARSALLTLPLPGPSLVIFAPSRRERSRDRSPQGARGPGRGGRGAERLQEPVRVTCLLCGPRCLHPACPVLAEPRVPPAVPA